MSYRILFSHSMCMSELHLHSWKKHLELSRRICHRWPFPFWSIIHVVWGFSVFGCAFWQWLCVLGWLSPCPALPCSLGFIFSECLVLKYLLLCFTSYCYPWLPKDAQVGARSKESLTNEGKVSSVCPLRTELGKVTDRETTPGRHGSLGSCHGIRWCRGREQPPCPSALLAWLRHHCLLPLPTMAVKESVDWPPVTCAGPVVLTWLLSPCDGFSSWAQYIMDRATNSVVLTFVATACSSPPSLVGAQAGCWPCCWISRGDLAGCTLVPVAEFPSHMAHALRGCFHTQIKSTVSFDSLKSAPETTL